MTAAAFDTLKLAERLGAGGFTPQQTQTAAAALSEVLTVDMATKVDLERDRRTLETRIAEAKWNTIKWMFGSIGFQTLVIIGAIAALLKLVH